VSKYLKIGIYGIWGVFLFLASMEKFGDLFAVGTGFWSVVMLSSLDCASYWQVLPR
jgi:hypothetical protein